MRWCSKPAQGNPRRSRQRAAPPGLSGRRRDATSTTGASKQRQVRCESFLRPHANLNLSSAAVLPHRAHDEVGLVGAAGGETRVKQVPPSKEGSPNAPCLLYTS